MDLLVQEKTTIPEIIGSYPKGVDGVPWRSVTKKRRVGHSSCILDIGFESWDLVVDNRGKRSVDGTEIPVYDFI
jgi:hypothetical protein